MLHSARQFSLFLSLAALSACSLQAAEIKPFTSDGCSMFPDGNLRNNAKWVQCCIKHDYAYWQGGTREKKAKADKELKSCVAELGEKNISSVMYFGVTLGGEPFFPTGYRWGYGWPYLRGYQALTESEQAQVKQRLIELRDFLNQAIEETP